MNKVIVIGNLTRDPDVKYTPKNTAVCDVGIALNHRWTNDRGERMESVTFLDCTLWGRTAEVCGEYARKGDKIAFEGRLDMDEWEDKETGKNRTKIKLVVEHMELIGRTERRDGGGDDNRGGSGYRGDSGHRGGGGGYRGGGGSTRGTSYREPEHRNNPPRPPRDPDLDAQPDDIPFDDGEAGHRQ